jgi:anion-transporting  ArsA/GET3 family ATPase
MDTDHDWLTRLMARRLIFVMGKGGVGKTTISIALAIEAARRDKKVLLVEVGDSDAMGTVFDGQAFTDVPRPVAGNIWCARVNPRSEFEAYIHTHVSPAFLRRHIINSRLFEYLLDAAPGLKEIMSLGRIWRWVTGTDNPEQHRFSLVIVDAPATGHALSLLRLPRQLMAMIRFGPLVAQIKQLRELLEDRKQTCLALVTLPEELPVNETIAFYPVAANTLNISVAVTFINGVYPENFSLDQKLHVSDLLSAMRNRADDDICRLLLETAHREIQRRSLQNHYIMQIQSNTAAGAVIEIPFYPTNALSLEEIERISSSLKTSGAIGAAS